MARRKKRGLDLRNMRGSVEGVGVGVEGVEVFTIYFLIMSGVFLKDVD